MEDHFERVLAAAAAPAKRPAPDQGEGDARQAEGKRARAEQLSRREIAALVAAGERAQIAELDARQLRSMARALEKKAKQNALLREKHADEPARFMDSEVALDEELARWKPVAAAPALFPTLVELGVAPLLLGLFSHENIDIRLSVVSLLAELTDVDEGQAALDGARLLATHLVDQKLLPLLVSNLFQLAAVTGKGSAGGEEEDEEETGIYNSLQILENLADVEPATCAQVAADTPIFQFLMLQVAPTRAFSQNKLYASEILSILLQSGSAAREEFMRPQDRHTQSLQGSKKRSSRDEKIDLMDELLQAMAPYRKKDPATDEEEELVENLVNSLCSLLLVPSAQDHFRRLEGIELMLRYLKDRRLYMFPAALRILDHALMDSVKNSERLIQAGGLKSIFSVFMGKKSAKAPANKKAKRDKAKEQENVISIVASMCAFVPLDAELDAHDRLHAKFVESDMEKMDRLVDLFGKYLARVDASTNQGNEEDEDDEDNEEEDYLRRLDAGLFVLQRVAFIVAHLCRFSKKLQAYIGVKFHERNIDIDRLSEVLKEQLDLLVADTAVTDDSSETDKGRTSEKEIQKQQLSALLEHLARGNATDISEDGKVKDEGHENEPVTEEEVSTNASNKEQ